MPKTILFDFDGTIAKTIPAGVAAFNKLARQYGFLEITDENADVLRDNGPRGVIRVLKIPLLRVPAILRGLRQGVKDSLPTIKAQEGVRSALLCLKSKGYELGMVTSNSHENVKTFLANNDMAGLFDYIQAGAGIFGKTRAIKKMIDSNKLEHRELVFVGDEIRDIEAAHKNQIAVVAVTWGLNSRRGLQNAMPDSMVDTPDQLLGVL